MWNLERQPSPVEDLKHNQSFPIVYSSRMVDIGNSIGEVSGVIRTMFGMTRHSRTRTQIQGNVDLYTSMIPHAELDDASSELAKIIIQQTKHLRDVSFETGRAWNWGAWSLSWVIAAGCLILANIFRGDSGSWWGITAGIISLLFFIVFFIVGLTVLLEHKAIVEDDSDDTGNVDVTSVDDVVGGVDESWEENSNL